MPNPCQSYPGFVILKPDNCSLSGFLFLNKIRRYQMKPEKIYTAKILKRKIELLKQAIKILSNDGKKYSSPTEGSSVSSGEGYYHK
jgi:hypothetical protein